MARIRPSGDRRRTACALALCVALAAGGCAPPFAQPPATAPPACPRRDPAAAAPALDPVDPEGSIRAALDAGASPLAVSAALASLGLGADAGLPYAEADLTGGGTPEVALAVAGWPSAPGALLVYTCRDGAYVALARLDGAQRAPILHAAADLNLDGADELLVGHPSCGAHTCFEQIEVYAWDGAALSGRLRGDSSDLPYPAVTIEPAGPGDPPVIAVSGTAVGSAGAGPYRPRTRTWAWSAGEAAFVVTAERLEPATHRIHLLHDADEAARAGDPPAALALYLRAITDSTLEDRSPEDRAALAAYAGFRRLLIHAARGEASEVEAAFTELLAAAPPGSPGRGYAEMAANFLEAYLASGDVGQACRTALAYAEAFPERVLQPLDYGYANRTYTAADLCPHGP